ncbi:MAG: Hsp70 family protein, partial [Amaricoccus sp.]
MRPDILAIDFGTSNSAAAILDGGVPRRLPIQPGSDTLPTAVFFPADGAPMRIGDAAGDALIAGETGRYMRALKSVLGT